MIALFPAMILHDFGFRTSLRRQGMLLLAVVAWCLTGCGGDDEQGGWSLPGTLYVCFSDSGQLGLGDSPEDAEDPCCDYNEDGTFLLDGHTGSWSVDGDTLTIEASDLAKDGAGPYELARDDSITCN